MGRKLPRVMVQVPCTLEGYEGVTVNYDVGVPFSSIEAAQNDVALLMRLLKIHVEGWDFDDDDGNPYPVPSAETGVDGLTGPFIRWLTTTGYQAAIKEAATPPNSESGLTPSSTNAKTEIKPQSKHRQK